MTPIQIFEHHIHLVDISTKLTQSMPNSQLKEAKKSIQFFKDTGELDNYGKLFFKNGFSKEVGIDEVIFTKTEVPIEYNYYQLSNSISLPKPVFKEKM